MYLERKPLYRNHPPFLSITPEKKPLPQYQSLRQGSCLNIKMPSYQYSNSHYKDKVVSWLSDLYNRNPHTSGWKDSFILIHGPASYPIMASETTISSTNWLSSPRTACRFCSLIFIHMDCSCSVLISLLMLLRSAWKPFNISSIRWKSIRLNL